MASKNMRLYLSYNVIKYCIELERVPKLNKKAYKKFSGVHILFKLISI